MTVVVLRWSDWVWENRGIFVRGFETFDTILPEFHSFEDSKKAIIKGFLGAKHNLTRCRVFKRKHYPYTVSLGTVYSVYLSPLHNNESRSSILNPYICHINYLCKGGELDQTGIEEGRMGGCSSTIDEEEQLAVENTKKIDKANAAEYRRNAEKIKVLLLGMLYINNYQ